MASADDGPIQGTSLALTKVSGGAATITSLGGAAIALFTITDSDPQSVKVAKIAAAAIIIAVGLIATAWIAAADVQARGVAPAGTAVGTAAAAKADNAAAANGGAANGAAANGGAAQAAAAWVKVRDRGEDLFLVVQAQHLEGDHTRYFVARNTEKPEWILENAIESWSVTGEAGS